MNLADRLILHPQPSVGAPGAERRFVGEPKVEIWRVPNPSAKAIIVRFYGNGDLADHWAVIEARSWTNMEVWAVNYPGYGGSMGPATLSGVARAAEVAFDAAKAEGKPIIVIGTSLGTTAALHLTATRDVAGAVLTNPPALPDMIMGDFGWWNLWILASRVRAQIPKELDSIANAKRSTCPVLVISSLKDEVVRAKWHRAIYDAYGGPKELLERPEARHNDPYDDVVHTRIMQALSK